VYAQMTNFFELVKTATPQEVQAAIGQGVDVNAQDEQAEHGENALMYAAEYNPNPEVIATLLKAGADINARNGFDATVLMFAVHNPNPAVITMLLKAGADVNADDQGHSALMGAVRTNNLAVVTTLLKAGAHVNAEDMAGSTVLMYAVSGEGNHPVNSNPEVITTLLKAGANVNAQNHGGGQSVLMWAAADDLNPEVITTLLKAGANVNTQDDDGGTALILALGNPNPEVIVTLLKAGANVNAQDDNGGTALIIAAHDQSPEVIGALLKAGADAKAKDNAGRTAFDYARWNAKLDGADVLKQLEVTPASVNAQPPDFVELLKTGTPELIARALRAGVDFNAPDRSGRTPLMDAATYNQNPEVIATLMKAGADIQARDGNGVTVLMWAAMNQNPEVFTEVYKAGADINAQDRQGMTSLMWAAQINPNPEMITTLLKAGANAKVKDRFGETAFHYAQTNAKLKGTNAYRQLEEASELFHATRGVLNDSQVRVRENPSLQAGVLGTLSKADKVEVLDRSKIKTKIDKMNDYWYKVRAANGLEGWMYGAYIDLSEGNNQ